MNSMEPQEYSEVYGRLEQAEARIEELERQVFLLGDFVAGLTGGLRFVNSGRPDAGNKFETVLAVVTGKVTSEGRFNILNIHGTAFSIGGGLLLTANHVVELAEDVIQQDKDNLFALARFSSTARGLAAVTCNVVERWPDIDVCVIGSTLLTDPENLMWAQQVLPVFSPVRALGYPGAADLQQDFVVVSVRGFSGTIVNGGLQRQLPGQPLGYELTFSAPKGLSGGPLLQVNGAVAGMILGNSRIVLDSQEVNEERILDERTQTVKIFESKDFMNLGIAIAAPVLLELPLPSGKKIRQHLANSGIDVG